MQGIGRQCPMYVGGTKNELTGRQVVDEQTIQYILKLHNEIRSKIAKGRCDQPIAGCMKPLVRCFLRLEKNLYITYKIYEIECILHFEYEVNYFRNGMLS